MSRDQLDETLSCPHHEQVAASHPDHADIGEGLHDVIKRDCGESVDGVVGVFWNALVDHLKDKNIH